jgi:hypothetical protein
MLGLGDVVGVLSGAGPLAGAADDPTGSLRVALHLNLAAAALKLSEWQVARVACELVLDSRPELAKALFRLAKAHEGAQDFCAAIATASRLLRCDAASADGRRLLEALRQRQRKEGEMFKGFFDRARDDNAEGDGLVTAAEEDRSTLRSMEMRHTRALDKTVAQFQGIVLGQDEMASEEKLRVMGRSGDFFCEQARKLNN